MKLIITALLLSLLSSTGFSQELKFSIRGAYERSVTKEKLAAAKTMGDIKTGYPASWITDYISTAVSVTSKGKPMTGLSKNDTLSLAQKSMLNMADLGTDVIIDVKYNYKNSATNILELNKLHFSLTVIPAIEAEYIGGSEQLSEYLNETIIQKILEPDSKEFQTTRVRFTVNEDGNAVDALIFKTSENPKTDNLILKAINNMPKWKPAENPKGVKVQQKFELMVFDTMSGEGC